tara:strand:+ start:2487 stop:3074 length:588 start_codon:yes stop_codon:yes gene_type:complete
MFKQLKLTSFYSTLKDKQKSLEILKNKKTLNILNKSIDLIQNNLSKGGKLLIMGNGGSAADAQHMAAELVGKYLKIRKPISALSLSVDTSILTSISNDLDFEKIFERQIDAIKKPNDIIFAITTSGKSKNIIRAIKFAKKSKLKIICLTSIIAPRSLEKICDIVIRVPEKRVDRIQELHIFIEHLICEQLEKFQR